jgi:hypothetical protein
LVASCLALLIFTIIFPIGDTAGLADTACGGGVAEPPTWALSSALMVCNPLIAMPGPMCPRTFFSPKKSETDPKPRIFSRLAPRALLYSSVDTTCTHYMLTKRVSIALVLFASCVALYCASSENCGTQEIKTPGGGFGLTAREHVPACMRMEGEGGKAAIGGAKENMPMRNNQHMACGTPGASLPDPPNNTSMFHATLHGEPVRLPPGVDATTPRTCPCNVPAGASNAMAEEPVEPKSSWPELEGATKAEAEALLTAEAPDAQLQFMPKDGMVGRACACVYQCFR